MIAKRIGTKRSYPVATNIVLLPGQPTILASGYLTNVLVAGVSVGVVTLHVDNSAGANGALHAEVETGEIKFAKHTDVVICSVGGKGYFVDGKTVSISSNSDARATAGIITQVDDDGVWVRVGL